MIIAMGPQQMFVVCDPSCCVQLIITNHPGYKIIPIYPPDPHWPHMTDIR